MAVVSVSDTGIGIQEGDLPRVFDIFSQVHSQEWRSDGGLGIGLALVKQLVEMHGGTVAASSPGPGNGSTFTVRLPLLAAAEAVSDVPTGVTHETFSNSCQRVLVVDDNVDAANSLSMLLGGMGHEVVTANDGPSAIAKATEFAPDFVLLDLGMPGMNGIETAVQLRKLPLQKRNVLIALTGWGQPHDREKTRAAGFDHHLLKPVEPSVLERLLAATR